MVFLTCLAENCTFQTEDYEEALLAATMMNNHIAISHSNQPPSSNRVTRVEQPSISIEMTPRSWENTVRYWKIYKKTANLKESELACHLIACCEPDLRDRLMNTHSNIENESEKEALKVIKEMSVKSENIIVAQVNHMKCVQGRDEPIRPYYARLKGQAKVCDYTVTHTVEGTEHTVSFEDKILRQILATNIADNEIQTEGSNLHGKQFKTKQMVYITEKTEAFYLSRSACRDLGIISCIFPTIGEYENPLRTATINQAQQNIAECGCLKRTLPPSQIKDPPCEFSERNREVLEKHILEQFSSSTFNVCPHQAWPEMHGPPMRLMIDRNAKPVAVHKAIPVPIHYQEVTKQGLDNDCLMGVIEPVPEGTPTTWCHRMVVCSKKSGGCRRTVDFQALNICAARETHHTPSPYQLAREVPSNTKKTVLDACHGYHSLELHKSDHHLTTFITPWGRYRYLRCPQGYIASGDAYTRRYDAIITDVKNKVKCVDDTLLWADTIEESYAQTINYVQLCGRNGIMLNPKKFKFGADEVEFAGFKINKKTISPIPTFLKAIENFPQPKNITDIRSWFGLVNQAAYSFSKCSVMDPFRELLKKGSQFMWNEDLEKAFNTAKQVIIEKIEQGVRIFEKGRRTCLATDWSKTGIGAWLLQKHCDCNSTKPFCCPTGWHVTLFCSRFLTEAESRYSAVEGESLAVIFGLEKCKHFILGCTDLVIAVDHKPLIGLFTQRSLDNFPNARLRNLKEKSLPYRFQITHISGVKNKVADCLSRSPSEPADQLYLIDDQDDILNEQKVASAALEPLITPLTLTTVALHTTADHSMRNLVSVIEEGFPSSPTEMPEEIRSYFKLKNYLSTSDGLCFYKNRVVIPRSLRHEALRLLHAAHQGTSGMMSRAETCIFWPGITNDIKNTRESCMKCNRCAPSNPEAPPKQPNVPDYPFQSICADFFSYRGTDYLVIVDRYSGWPIVERAKDGASGLTNTLKSVVNTFGVPEELSSDGGPQFVSSIFKKTLRQWGTHHRISSVAHARSNGRAEVAVKSMKRLLMDNTGPNGSLNTDKFLEAILQYRNTPDTATGISPAKYIFHRPIRDFLPDINIGKHLDWEEIKKQNQEAREKNSTRHISNLSEHTRELPQLKSGCSVTCRVCSTEQRVDSVEALPTEFSLLAIIAARDCQKAETCKIHEVKLSFWCRTCGEATCGECLFEDHPTHSHDVVRAQKYIQEMRIIARDIADKFMDALDTREQRFYNRVFKGARAISNALRSVNVLRKDMDEARTLMKGAREVESIVPANELADAAKYLGLKWSIQDVNLYASKEKQEENKNKKEIEEKVTEEVQEENIDNENKSEVKENEDETKHKEDIAEKENETKENGDPEDKDEKLENDLENKECVDKNKEEKKKAKKMTQRRYSDSEDSEEETSRLKKNREEKEAKEAARMKRVADKEAEEKLRENIMKQLKEERQRKEEEKRKKEEEEKKAVLQERQLGRQARLRLKRAKTMGLVGEQDEQPQGEPGKLVTSASTANVPAIKTTDDIPTDEQKKENQASVKKKKQEKNEVKSEEKEKENESTKEINSNDIKDKNNDNNDTLNNGDQNKEVGANVESENTDTKEKRNKEREDDEDKDLDESAENPMTEYEPDDKPGGNKIKIDICQFPAFQIVVEGYGGRLARMEWEDKGLHVYCHQFQELPYDVIIKSAVLYSLIPTKSPLVFMDINGGKHSLGRVYIRLWGHLRRAQNFLTLCLGDLGTCYMCTRMLETYNDEVPGERIKGGDYEFNNGHGGKGVIQDLEHSTEYSMPMESGMISSGGAHGEPTESQFMICTESNPDSNFVCPFGTVVAGLQIVKQAVHRMTVQDVWIRDCGIVIETSNFQA